jgi:hypothetical protein
VDQILLFTAVADRLEQQQQAPLALVMVAALVVMMVHLELALPVVKASFALYGPALAHSHIWQESKENHVCKN